MKLIVELSNKNLVKKYLKFNNISYLIVGFEGLSFNACTKFSIEEISEIYNLLKNSNVKLILNAERLFTDKELNGLDNLINNGFFNYFEYITYSDFGIKIYLENKGVNIKYIFKAATYLTNSCDVNEYNLINDYVVLSSEISSEELIELSKNINKNAIVDLFGKSACFYSRRPLLTNYFKYREMSNDPKKDNYYVVEELRSDYLSVVENEIGTIILEPKFHVLAEEINKLENIEFGIICFNKLNQKNMILVVDAYNNLLNDFNIECFYKNLNDTNVEYYKGAYNIKSVLLKGGCNE